MVVCGGFELFSFSFSLSFENINLPSLQIYLHAKISETKKYFLISILNCSAFWFVNKIGKAVFLYALECKTYLLPWKVYTFKNLPYKPILLTDQNSKRVFKINTYRSYVTSHVDVILVSCRMAGVMWQC